jgi:hypothetical protein
MDRCADPTPSRRRTAASTSVDAARSQSHTGLDYAIAKGWLWLHESGTYVKLTPAGAELFA